MKNRRSNRLAQSFFTDEPARLRSCRSDMEIVAVANYVTSRFGGAAPKLAAKDVAQLRGQTDH